jgi:alpha-galactosidase
MHLFKQILISSIVLAETLTVSQAETQVIETAHTQLILTENQLVNQQYYGVKVSHPDETSTLKGQTSPVMSQYGGGDNLGVVQVTHADGNLTTEMQFLGKEVKKESDTSTVYTFKLKDKYYPFYMELHFRACYDVDIIERWATYHHDEKSDVVMHSYPAPQVAFAHLGTKQYVTHFPGTWGSEMRLTETQLTPGLLTLENNAGARSAFGANPSLILSVDHPANETTGDAIGCALAWTGPWRIDIRKGLNNDISITAGNNIRSAYTLEPGKVLTSPKFITTYSHQGKGQVSRNFHRWARKYCLNEGTRLRPILLNSWEGAYMNFKEKTLTDMMDGVADLGGEMFVLDDGWFGNGKFARDNAKAGLGDWQVNTKKLPHGIKYLTDYAKSKGIKFGIWVEPEMFNTNSELYKKHPEWSLMTPHRKERWGRGGTQGVLDMGNPEVQDFVFKSVDDLLTQNPEIAYIKWDANHDIPQPGSTYEKKDRQSNLYYDYTRGYYNVMKRLTEKHPKVIFKVCASGGGRVEFGSLEYGHEFWTSDNTDAMQRIFMQWGTGHIYPAAAMACHVSASPNHQTHRKTPIKFRFDVAMMGRLGLELHPTNMTKDELTFSKAAIATYKSIRPVVQQGDLYRLISPYTSNYASLMYVSEKKNRAVLFAYCHKFMKIYPQPHIKLQGLDPKKKYKIVEINKYEGWQHAKSIDGKTLSGDTLMNIGSDISLDGSRGKKNRQGDYDSAVFEITEV